MNTWSLHSRSLWRTLFGGTLAVIGCLAHGAEGATFTVNDPVDEPDVFPGDGVEETSPGSATTTLSRPSAKRGDLALLGLLVAGFLADRSCRSGRQCAGLSRLRIGLETCDVRD